MLQMESKIKTCDNSGAKVVKCIHCFGGFNRVYGYVGDLILVSVQSLRFVRKVKKGQMLLALIVRSKKLTTFKDGSYSYFGLNSVVLLNNKKRLVGSKIKGPVSKKLRKLKMMRILQLCSYNFI